MYERVFAFGSNMCSGRLLDYRVHPEGQGEAACLMDYRLAFNKRSKDGSGKANVLACAGERVWGVLWTIPHEELRVLDKGEGRDYSRKPVKVSLQTGEFVTAWSYIAVQFEQDESVLKPYTWYKRFLVEGAREHGLPLDYISKIDAIEARNDSDTIRDEEKHLLKCGLRGPIRNSVYAS